MKARLLVAAIIVLTGLASGVLPAQAATLTVCPSGCAYSRIQAAIDAASPGDTIVIQAGTYRGNISIAKNLTLSGASGTARANIIIQGDYAFDYDNSVVSVASGVTARINGVTITGGSGFVNINYSPAYSCYELGGGIYNEGSLMLQNDDIQGNSAGEQNCGPGEGGGIYNAGDVNKGEPKATLILSDSAVTDNSTGCVFCTDDVGGGIANYGTMTISNSGVRENASNNGGGIGNYGMLTLRSSDVTNNAGENGDGIINSGTLTIQKNSQINGNTTATYASGNGGGIYNTGLVTVQNSQISGNATYANPYSVYTDTGFGGGIYSVKGTVTLRNSSVTQNTADRDGGGIFNTAALTLQHSAVTQNTAGRDGGGIFNQGGNVTLHASPIQNNVPNDCAGC